MPQKIVFSEEEKKVLREILMEEARLIEERQRVVKVLVELDDVISIMNAAHKVRGDSNNSPTKEQWDTSFEILDICHKIINSSYKEK